MVLLKALRGLGISESLLEQVQASLVPPKKNESWQRSGENAGGHQGSAALRPP